jgi:protein arginine kinase
MTLDFSLLPDSGMSWLDASGTESRVVLSTRLRLARNLQGMAFTLRAKPEDLEAARDRIVEAGLGTASLRDAITFQLDGLDLVDRQLLHERHMISRELAGLERNQPMRHAAALLTTGSLGVMINEEDHLRLQSLQSGFDLSRAYGEIERLDADLGEHLPVAFHPEFGYLTACPTNAGTGLRASVLIHLPGLVLTKEIAKVLQGLSQVGLTFRGLYGEGSEVVGNFFQPDDARQVRRGVARPPGQDGATGGRLRSAGAGGTPGGSPGGDRRQGVAGVRPAAVRAQPVV